MKQKMNYLISKSIQGKLFLPLFFILLIIHFLFFILIIEKFYNYLSPARGFSKVSIDLQASFIQVPGGAKAEDKESGVKEKTGRVYNLGNIFSLKEGKIAENYLGKILRKIEKSKYYPKTEQEKGHEGIVKLKFVLKRDGSIQNIELLKKVQYEKLNRAAINILNNSRPFPLFPRELKENSLPIIIDLEFKVQ